MKKAQSSHDPKAFNPINPQVDDYQGTNIVELLPTGQDIAKVFIIMIVVAAAIRVEPRFSDHLARCVRNFGGKEYSAGTTEVVVAKKVDSPAHRPKNPGEIPSQVVVPSDGCRPIVSVSVSVSVEVVAVQGATGHSQGRSIASHEFPLNYQCPRQSVMPRSSRQNDHPRITYFDNAGRSYLTKAERDAAESHQLAESLSRYPAMKSEQRKIMRQRAFARLEMLDAQQQMRSGP